MAIPAGTLDAYVDAHADRGAIFQFHGKLPYFVREGRKPPVPIPVFIPYQRAKGFADVYQKNSRVDATQEYTENVWPLTRARRRTVYAHDAYTHGIACMLATGAADIPAEEVLPKVNFACLAFYSQLGKEITCN